MFIGLNINSIFSHLNVENSGEGKEEENLRIFPQSCSPSEPFSYYNLQPVEVFRHCQEHEFFQLQEMLIFFEVFLKKHESSISRDEIDLLRFNIHSVIRQIKIVGFKEVMAELGAICHYLEKNRKPLLITETSFLLLYEKELINELKKVSLEVYAPGQKTLLLQAFAQLIMCQDETINQGGTYGILSLLSGEIGRYFKDEHLGQIKAVLRHLQKNPATFSLLQKPLPELPPDTQLLIKVDLKMRYTDSVGSWHAKLVCLIFLFDDLRQVSTDCYLIPPLLLAIRQAPYKVASKLLHYLTFGYILAGNANSFPILPIVLDRLFPHEVLSAYATAQTYQLQAALQACDVEASDYLGWKSTVNNLIDGIFRNAKKELSLVGYAKMLYCSFTHNVMQQVILSSMMFLEMNRPEGGSIQESSGLVLVPVKRQIGAALQIALKDVRTTFPDYKETNTFLNSLVDIIERRLWLVSRSDVTYPEHYPLSNEARALLARHQIFYSMSKAGGPPSPLSSLTAFKHALCAFVAEIEEESSDRSPTFFTFCSLLKAYFISSKTNEILCTLMYTFNKKEFGLISEKEYHQLGAFIFARPGRPPLGAFNDLDLSLKSEIFILDRDEPHIIDLCKWLNHFQYELNLDDIDNIFMAINNNHGFILTPSHFMRLISENPEQALMNLMRFPGLNLLLRPLSEEKIQKILYPLAHEPFWLCRGMKAFELKNHFLKILNKEELYRFQKAFERVLLETPTDDLKNNESIEIVLNHLYGLQVNSPKTQMIKETLLDSFEKREVTPLEIAFGIKKAVLGYGFPEQEIYDIEFNVCQVLQLPCTFVLGDLNYTRKREDNPDHTLLTYKFNLWTEKLDFGCISHTEEVEIDPVLRAGFEQLRVVYPSCLF